MIDYVTDLTGITPALLFRGILNLDMAVYKAAGADAYTMARRAEARLYAATSAIFTRRARDATARAGETVIQSGAHVDERELETVLQTVSHSFLGWAREAQPIVHAGIDTLYRLGKNESVRQRSVHKAKKKPKEVSLTASFNVVDKAAVEAMAEHQVFWMANSYDTVLSDTIANIAKNVLIEQGLGREEGAQMLERELAKAFGYNPAAPTVPWSTPGIPAKWNGTGLQYLEGLAANTATTARIAGTFRGYTEMGITRYTWVNPDDERTCPRCGGNNGRTFEVAHAAKQVEAVISADDPRAVRDAHPWPSEGEYHKVVGDGAKDDIKVNRQIASLGWGVPPLHYRCRCLVDIADSEELSFD